MQALLQALDLAVCDADLLVYMETRAILFTDLSGYSIHPLLIHGLQRVLQMERALSTFCAASGGQMVKALGDSHLVLFNGVEDALACVEAMRVAMPDNPFCAGIGYGPVVVCRHDHRRVDVFGVEVSAASRLGEDLAVGTEVFLT